MQTAARNIELAHRTARLQWSCDDAVVDELAFHDMGGVADHGFDRADLATVELERDVAPRLRPDHWGVRQNGVRDRDHRRQRRIVDDDSFGGIARDLSAFRDHECDRLADIANDVARQRVTGGTTSGVVIGILVTAHGSGPILSAASSCPVSTAATPGILRAASTLIAVMRACECGERTTAP